MKNKLTIFIVFYCLSLISYSQNYDDYIFSEWDNPKYLQANTAKDVSYLSEIEKQIIYIHNLIRIDPELFNNTFIKKIKAHPPNPSQREGDEGKEIDTSYILSLEQELLKIDELPLLYPDKNLYKAAVFHAKELFKSKRFSHYSSDGKNCFDRIEKYVKDFEAAGENLYTGSYEPLEIVLLLLIDEGDKTLGHRKNILDKSYKKIGVGFYKGIAVMDFTD